MRDDEKNVTPEKDTPREPEVLQFYFTPLDEASEEDAEKNPHAKSTTRIPEEVEALRGEFGEDVIWRVETYANEDTVFVDKLDHACIQDGARLGFGDVQRFNHGDFETLERMQEQSGQSIPTWQSTHPDPGARQQRIPELAQQWRDKVERTATMINQEAYYGALENIVLGNNPRQGFTEGDTFYHPDLAFRFSIPSGWNVQNQPRQVAIVHPDQSAYMLFRALYLDWKERL